MSLIGIPVHQKVQEEDFSYSVSLFENECLPTPQLLLHTSLIPLAVILTILLIMIMMVAKVAQLRLLVCERFFPDAAEARVEYLHAKILRKRMKKRPPAAAPPSSKVGFGLDHQWEGGTLTWLTQCFNAVGNFFFFFFFFQLQFLFPLIFRPKKIPKPTV